MKILIIENEFIIALSMKDMLSELRYNDCTITNTEEQAKELIESLKYDLVILDINLKNGEEGINLAKICYAKSIPFFYVTSYTDKATLDRAIETAPGAYITKPFLPDNLYSAIELTLSSQIKQNTSYIAQ
jgi:two-component SAPR family response regulator